MKDICQGAIYYANLNPVKGHEQAGYRPVIILQNNVLNKHLNTVIIAPITTNLNAQGLLTTYLLKKKISKLTSDSIILLFQIRTIDKARLQKFISTLPSENFREIKQQFSFIF